MARSQEIGAVRNNEEQQATSPGMYLRRRGITAAPVVTLLFSMTLAMAGCVVLSLSTGRSPFALLVTIADGAWGSTEGTLATLAKVTPLLLTGTSVAMAYQVGLLNIGGEGQLTLGALAAASFAVIGGELPGFLLIPGALLAGLLVGVLWAYPAIWLRRQRAVHEVIVGLLMNYTAAHLGDYLVRGPLGDGTAMARSPLVPAAALWKPVYSAGASDLTLAPLVALGLSLILQVWLSRTVWGYEARACGSNPQAALRAGIAVGRWQGRLFLLSGGMAGLAGALEVLSVHHRFYAAFSPGYGYDGVAVAFLVNGAPGWLWLSSAILASMRASDKWLQLSLGVSPNTVHILVAFLLIVMTCQSGWKHLWAQLAGAPRVGDEVDSLGVETHP